MNGKTRNIVLLGRTGVGKATVANQIAETDLFQIGTPLEGVTRQVRDLEDEITDGNVLYRFRTIDTVGPYGQSSNVDDTMSKIKDFAISSRGVHLLLLIFRNGALTDEEIQAFKTIMKILKIEKIKSICALVITGCESLGENAKQELVDEIKTLEDTKQIAAFMGKGIHPVGFPRLENIEQDFKEGYERGITSDSKRLRELVTNDTVLPHEIFLSYKLIRWRNILKLLTVASLFTLMWRLYYCIYTNGVYGSIVSCCRTITRFAREGMTYIYRAITKINPLRLMY